MTFARETIHSPSTTLSLATIVAVFTDDGKYSSPEGSSESSSIDATASAAIVASEKTTKASNSKSTSHDCLESIAFE